MLALTIITKGMEALEDMLRRAPGRINAHLNREKVYVGRLVQRESRRNAKIGPSDRQPGGLVQSITFETGRDYVRMYVPSNSDAGDYAKIQHDVLEGRGPGTRAKGSRAGWKFIQRAINDNKQKIEARLGSAFRVVAD